MVPKVKSQVPVRDVLVAVSVADVPANWLMSAEDVTTVAVGVGEGWGEVDVTGAGVGEIEGMGVAVDGGAGMSGVSVTVGKGTMVGVDEAAAAPLKAIPQPLNKISKTKNKLIKVVFLIISTPVSNVLS
jgi:hypothetical protein